MARGQAGRVVRRQEFLERLRPDTNSIAIFAASIMCNMRTRSSACILHLGGAHHLVAEVRAQILRRTQIYLTPAQQGGQIGLHARKAYEPGDRTGLELHQEIDIAVR
jgi:hypothetical protein